MKLFSLSFTIETPYRFLSNSWCYTPPAWLEVDILQSETLWSCYYVTTFYLQRHLSFGITLVLIRAHYVAAHTKWPWSRCGLMGEPLFRRLNCGVTEDIKRTDGGWTISGVWIYFIRQKCKLKVLLYFLWSWIFDSSIYEKTYFFILIGHQFVM